MRRSDTGPGPTPPPGPTVRSPPVARTDGSQAAHGEHTTARAPPDALQNGLRVQLQTFL